jgi:copper chaperone
MERVSLKIDGMSCDHCVLAVTRAVQGLDGVEAERVEIGSARLRYDPARNGVEEIVRAIEDEGYAVSEQESTR